MKWILAVLVVMVVLALLALVFRQVGMLSRRGTNTERKPRPGLSPVQQIQAIPPTSGQRNRDEGRVREEIEEKRKS